jgi:hypothetical protein
MPKQRVSDLAAHLKEPDKYRVRLLGSAYVAAFLASAALSDSQLINQSLNHERYTPAKYLEPAREVLGGIDLDPASCEEANKTVGATTFFDKTRDGLLQEWWGRVWLNPPYGDLAGAFIDKLSEERAAGRVTAAICLVNAHSS